MPWADERDLSELASGYILRLVVMAGAWLGKAACVPLPPTA